jgi:hypothetical protein
MNRTNAHIEGVYDFHQILRGVRNPCQFINHGFGAEQEQREDQCFGAS